MRSDPAVDRTTVLAVDDEPDLVELYQVFLEPVYDVRIATDGESALEAMNEEVDVVLLDRRMPDMSGEEVLTEMRAAGYDARVAMLTAVEPDVDIVDMPFDDYMTKPVGEPELLALIKVLSYRATFDEQSQKFFALASKKAALEAGGKQNTEAYRDLTAELSRIRAAVDDTLDELSATDAFTEITS